MINFYALVVAGIPAYMLYFTLNIKNKKVAVINPVIFRECSDLEE